MPNQGHSEAFCNTGGFFIGITCITLQVQLSSAVVVLQDVIHPILASVARKAFHTIETLKPTAMKLTENHLLLRITVAIILVMHSIPGMFNNGVYEFGKFYLDESGFSPLGVPLAWAIKISHVVAALLILFNRYVKPAAAVIIAILLAGIIMVHGKDGWFVVGGGRNGIEFNVLLIAVLLTLMFPQKRREAGL